ncbi:MAG TPA: MlaD family protein [Bryobacteraceae bacterium]|nr:MlaD family protein [Bryobacteraceae bacterium]
MRERTLVGLFVLVAVGLLVGAMLAISGGVATSTVKHRTFFKFAGGVQAGAPVRYGGMTVGRVTRVRVDPSNSTRIEIQLAVDHDTPVKTDSVAKISTLGPLTDNYIEITTGTENAPLAPPGSVLQSTEAFGLPQLGDAAQAMLPDIHNAIAKLNQNLDGLTITIARANDLLNDHNRAAISGSLGNLNHLVADARPKVAESLNNLNGLLNDTRPKVTASLTNTQEITKTLNAKLGPLLDQLQTTTARANETLSHVDATLVENRPDIRAVVVNLRDTLAQLNQTLDQNSPNIDELLDNIRMATENLRALTETLRQAPASLIRGIKVKERKPGDQE